MIRGPKHFKVPLTSQNIYRTFRQGTFVSVPNIHAQGTVLIPEWWTQISMGKF
jgi:hypothetical protein